MNLRTVRKAMTGLAIAGGLLAATSAVSQPIPSCRWQCWRDCLALYPNLDEESAFLREECYLECLEGCPA